MKCYYILIISALCFILSGCGKKIDLEESQKNTIDEEVKSEESIDDTNDSKKKITKNQLISSTKNFEDVVNQPDKMVYYHNGESFTITTENTAFNDILAELKGRFTDKMSSYKSINEFPDGLDQAKKNDDFLELFYNQEIIYDIEGISSEIKEIKYTGLLFPLSGDYEHGVLFIPWNNRSPIGGLESSKKLIEILEKIK